MYIDLHVKYPLFVSDIDESWIFSKDKKKQISNFMIIRLVGAELLHVDERKDRRTERRTDRNDEANSCF